MEAIAIANVYRENFIAYCKKYRKDVHDSFLYDEDLRDFELNDDNPTYVILNHEREMIAAASLMIDEYNKRGKDSFVLVRENTEEEEPANSTDYTIRDFRQGKDEEVW